VLVVVAGLGYGAYRWLSPNSSSAPINSLAVLPFTNVTADPNTDYLSDSLTESLIGSRWRRRPGLYLAGEGCRRKERFHRLSNGRTPL